MNGAMYVAMPKNVWSSWLLAGGAICLRPETLSGSGCIPSGPQMRP